jgi:hypothetical protein
MGKIMVRSSGGDGFPAMPLVMIYSFVSQKQGKS